MRIGGPAEAETSTGGAPRRLHAAARRRGQRPAGAKTIQLEPGAADIGRMIEGSEPSLGLFIIDGLILLEVGVGRGQSGWLVGADDLLRPWEMDEVPLLSGCSWRVLTRTRFALLDHEFVQRARGDPAVWSWALSRLAHTAHWLLAKTLLISSPRVEERLLLMFTLLAERWGKVTPEGIRVDLPLTHMVLARLIGAHRPTVSVTLKALQEQGVLTRTADRGYLLCPAGPAIQPVRARCWRECMRVLGW